MLTAVNPDHDRELVALDDPGRADNVDREAVLTLVERISRGKGIISNAIADRRVVGRQEDAILELVRARGGVLEPHGRGGVGDAKEGFLVKRRNGQAFDSSVLDFYLE